MAVLATIGYLLTPEAPVNTTTLSLAFRVYTYDLCLGSVPGVKLIFKLISL
jgi:hypothetical protein